MVMTHPPAFHVWKFLMKHMIPTNSGLTVYYYWICIYHRITCGLHWLHNKLKLLHMDKQYRRIVPLWRERMRAVVLCGKQSEDSWQKKADYQEGLVLTVQNEAMTATWKTRIKGMHEATKVTWRIRKRVVLTLQHEAAKVTRKTWRRVVMIVLHRAMIVIYLKDPEKSRARSHENYMRDPEKSRDDSAAQSRES